MVWEMARLCKLGMIQGSNRVFPCNLWPVTCRLHAFRAQSFAFISVNLSRRAVDSRLKGFAFLDMQAVVSLVLGHAEHLISITQLPSYAITRFLHCLQREYVDV